MRRWLLRAALGLGVLLLLGAGAAWLLLRASLPRLDGRLAAPGILGRVTIQRDALGVVTVRAANRADLAWGTGFAHAQDRFFQMDLARRLAAGELAELFGEPALGHDRRARSFRFRALAREVVAQSSPGTRAIAAAYAGGVNAGLESLGARPWEYLVLGVRPERWREEDSLLVLCSMWWQLQYPAIERDIEREAVRAAAAALPEVPGSTRAFDFLFPRGTEWDAPLGADAAVAGPVAPPLPGHWNLRARSSERRSDVAVAEGPLLAAGSNGFAVAGGLTANGAALVANDMHLGLATPTVWYHMRLVVEAGGAMPPLVLDGVTLAGAPALVAGSNGHVAWALTNSYGSWVETEPAPCDAPGYRRTTESLGVRGRGAPERLIVRDAPHGRILERRPGGCYAVRWVALDPEATNLGFLALEEAGSLAEALAAARLAGIPHQNFIAGDRAGHIGWTVAGRIPQRTATGALAAPGAFLAPESYPEVIDPPSGRLWTANARAAGDERSELAIGGEEAANGADYDLGARARQIRDDLLAHAGPIGPRELLGVQLDDRALFLDRWRGLLLGLLDAAALEGHDSRRALRRVLQRWEGRADAASVSYRLVRGFRDRVERASWAMMVDGLGVEHGRRTRRRSSRARSGSS